MVLKTYQKQDAGIVTALWNQIAEELNYKAFSGVDDWTNQVCADTNFAPEGLILAWSESNELMGFVLTVCKTVLLPSECLEKTPGFLAMLIVNPRFRNMGIGSELLKSGENYLRSMGKSQVMFSHKCPIKLSWFVNSAGHEHNKAPGIKIDCYGYQYLLQRGYDTKQYEVSYYLKLSDFIIPREIALQILALEKLGFQVTYYDSTRHFGYVEMFKRLEDESFLKKFEDGIAAGQKILVMVDGNGQICGSAGTIFTEKGGRGFFSALAIDPLFGGKGLGSMLFFRLCEEQKKIGSEYMTLFVTKSNYARKIYEKAGFQIVQEWAILKKCYD